MKRDSPLRASGGSLADALREKVAKAPGDRERLGALLELARHFVDVADGVNGFNAAVEARALALELEDLASGAHALNSISVSQYHRSEYVSAIATALTAWDYAKRSRSKAELADSQYSIALSLFGLGQLEAAEKIIALGLERSSAAGHAAHDARSIENRTRLKRLKGLLLHTRGAVDEAERVFRQAIALAEKGARSQLAACHAMCGIAWLRKMDEHYGGGPVIKERLAEVRKHLEVSLAIAEEEGDAFVATDRTALLGVVALFERDLAQAERLLASAMEHARALDYVRSFVVAAIYLGRLHLERGDWGRAVAVLREAVSQAERGAADDLVVYARGLLATALDRIGAVDEAARERAMASAFRQDSAEARKRMSESAFTLLAGIL